MTTSPIRLAAQSWEMLVRPERGGRITSLRLDGEELLDQGIGVDQPTAKGFVEGGAFGWDEMVPNLEPTASVPDHGEAWRLEWEVIEEGVLRCRGSLVPWELTRRVEIGTSIDLHYAYRNVGAEPHAAFWCAHPLFKYEPDMAVSVPLPRLEEGRSAKLYLERASLDRVRLGWRSETAIELSWDPALTPDVAIWVCNGDLGGYHQIAIEPATSSPMLEPGETLQWWLRITPL